MPSACLNSRKQNTLPSYQSVNIHFMPGALERGHRKGRKHVPSAARSWMVWMAEFSR